MRISLVAATVAVLLTLAGCDTPYPYKATQSDVPGTWAADHCGSRLVFAQDGSLTATQFKPNEDSPVDGAGTWTFTDTMSGLSSYGVEVTVGQTSAELYFIQRKGEPVVLLDIIGDADDGRACNFTRA